MDRDHQPLKPSGTDPEAVHQQAGWAKNHGASSRFNDSSTVKVKRTTKGYSWHAKPPKGGTTASGITYEGTFDPTKSYKKGAIVRVQTGTSQGVWICVVDGLEAGIPPVFPEPITAGGTNNWDMFNFGVQASVDCQNGNRVIYVNSSAPIT